MTSTSSVTESWTIVCNTFPRDHFEPVCGCKLFARKSRIDDVDGSAPHNPLLKLWPLVLAFVYLEREESFLADDNAQPCQLLANGRCRGDRDAMNDLHVTGLLLLRSEAS